jgi:hypothetical protein
MMNRRPTDTTWRWMVVLLLACAPGGLGAQQAPGPTPLDAADPSARTAGRLVELLLAGDRAAVVEHLRAEAVPGYVASERMEAEVRSFLALLAAPGLAIQGYLRGPGADVMVRVASAAARPETVVAVRLEEEPPHRITGLLRPTLMGPGFGPPEIAEPDPLGDAERGEVVESVAELLERLYPAPDTGQAIADHLRARQRAGAFDGLGEAEAFAARLTQEMQSINADPHLNVRLAMTAGRPTMPSPEEERAANYYLSPPEVLEGNVGYLRVHPMLSGQPGAIERLGSALRVLEGTDAMIVDLRGVGGGAVSMANAIISHFTAPDVPSLRVSSRMTGETYVRTTLPAVPGPRRTEVPLYVLVDRRSASAAEDVPFVLQNLGRATIVGERTRGAGRNNAILPVGHGFIASVSHSRVQDPVSGREWELVGVQPDIAVDPEQALEAAHRHALGRRGVTAR